MWHAAYVAARQKANCWMVVCTRTRTVNKITQCSVIVTTELKRVVYIRYITLYYMHEEKLNNRERERETDMKKSKEKTTTTITTTIS
jgi:hypothetical protein